jgi:copper transport protein
MQRKDRRSRACVTTLLLAVALLGFPTALFPHAKLVRSDPAPGSTVLAPVQITLAFTERPEVALSSVKLLGPAGDTIVLALSRDTSDANTIHARVPLGIIPGRYRVLWRAAGSDGHPSHGVIDFVVRARNPLARSVPAAQVMQMPEEPGATMAIGGALSAIFARWLTFVSTFLVIGAVAFRLLILRRINPAGAGLFTEIAETNAATLGIVAAVGAILGGMLRINRETMDMPDVALDVMMLDSIWGFSILLHIAGSLGVIVSLYWVHKAREQKRALAWRAAMISAAAIAVAPAIGGHALAGEPVIVSVIADIVHVVAGSVWLGSLAVIMMVGISAALKTPDTVRPGERVASMINVFSPVALTCGGAMVATGIISAIFHLPTLRSLWTTPYGATLMLKLFFVMLLFAAGAWNWRRMKPRLTGDNEIAPIRSSATLELVLATVVLVVTSLLVALELP